MFENPWDNNSGNNKPDNRDNEKQEKHIYISYSNIWRDPIDPYIGQNKNHTKFQEGIFPY